MVEYGELEDVLMSHLKADNGAMFRRDTADMYLTLDRLDYTSRSLQTSGASDKFQDYVQKYKLSKPQALYNIAIMGDIMEKSANGK